MPDSSVSRLFDLILELKDDEVLVVPFKTEAELHTKKTQLFREKQKYEKSCTFACKGIVIQQEIKRDKEQYRLRISTSGEKLDWLTGAFIEMKGGEIKKAVADTLDSRIKELKMQDM